MQRLASDEQLSFVPWTREELEQSVPARFRDVASRHGPRLALKDGPLALTYEELDRSSNALAQEILALCGAHRGTQPEPVAILMDHGVGIIVAIMAAVKAGKIYLPLDPSQPSPMLSRILDEAQPGLLIADTASQALGSELFAGRAPLLVVHELATNSAAPDPQLALAPDTPFSLTYTSGSTGRPKGVLHNHRNLLHVVHNVSNRLEITPADRHTHLLSSSFGASVSNIFGALLNGASLFPFDLKREGLEAMARWLHAEEITVYHTVPTVFRQFLRTLQPEERFPHMRVIKLGGERVLKHDVEQFRLHFEPDCLLHATLGTSEAHVVCWYTLRAGEPFDQPVLPAGYAENDAEILLLSEAGQILDAGAGGGEEVMGEIAVRSRYLFSGYWRNPEQTAAVFAGALADGERRVYRTGDLGRLAAGGLLEHLGRKDFQVKIRGQRVDLAAVEAALLDLEEIREAAVEARTVKLTGGPQHLEDETRLVAYVVPVGQQMPGSGQLRRALVQRLPAHAIPSCFMRMASLPLLPFGKVNRRALPEPDWARPELEVSYVAPRNELESELAQIWAETLGVRQVGVDDNFFDLGGHSLLATSLVNRIRQELEVELGLDELLRAATVAELALIIASDKQPPAGDEALAQALRRLGTI